MELIWPKTDDQIHACYGAVKELRPHLTEESFFTQVKRQQAQGYQMVAVKIDEQVVSFAGFRLCEFLAWGKILYIDDLHTIPSARGKGAAGLLLDTLIEKAQQEQCDAVHLDSGHRRHDAHRLYLNKGFNIASHHFSHAL